MINAMIGPRRKKLMNRVVVGAVNLDAVETGFSSKRSRLSKACNQVFNLIGRHRPWRLCSGTQRCNRRRRTQTLLTYQLGLCDAATVIYLEDRKTSCSTHRFSEPVETGQVSIMCRTYSLPGAPVLFDVSGGRNGSSESAGSTSPDKFEFVFGSRSIFMGRIGCQRSNDKPICDLSSAVEPERRPNNHRSNLNRIFSKARRHNASRPSGRCVRS